MAQEVQEVGSIEVTQAMVDAGMRRLDEDAGLHLEQIEDRLPELVAAVLRASLASANLLGPFGRSEEGKRSFLSLT